MISTPSTDSEVGGPRKKIRKGTHSCLECRRRKIRCVFIQNARICNECTSRGTACVDQQYSSAKSNRVDKAKNVRERMAELEGVISQLLTKLDGKDGRDGRAPAPLVNVGDSEMDAAEALKCLRSELLPSTINQADVSATPSGALELPRSSQNSESSYGSSHPMNNAPLLTLFDNAIISHRAEHSLLDVEKHQPLSEKNARVLKALRVLVPTPTDLTLIIQTSQNSWKLWEETFPEAFKVTLDGLQRGQIQSLLDFMYESLKSDNVAVNTKIWLCLALCLQQLPGKFDFSQTRLPAPAEALQDHYITSVETLLASDEGFACTLDGLECLMLVAKFYVNIGKPRKAWLIFRRAVSLGLLLRLHRHQGQGDQLARRRKATWLLIWQGDRYLSLLLGLPYAALESHMDAKLVTNGDFVGVVGQLFCWKISVITGHLIDRNQDREKLTLASTLILDEELEECRKLMPPEWWDASPGPHMPLDAIYDMLIVKFLYHNVRKLTHLPLMLKSPMDRRYDFSRVATLESAREMVKIYQIMRDGNRPVITVCNVVDFQVFTAAMVLILNLLGYSEYSQTHDTAQEEKDWEIVYSVTRDLKRVSEEKVCSVATQAARTLEDFCGARYGCEEDVHSYEAVIPYFGKIRIEPGKGFGLPTGCSPASQHTQQLPTPPEAAQESLVQPNADPLVSFDSYLQPLSEDESRNQLGTDWASMVDLDLREDWNWFANGAEAT